MIPERHYVITWRDKIMINTWEHINHYEDPWCNLFLMGPVLFWRESTLVFLIGPIPFWILECVSPNGAHHFSETYTWATLRDPSNFGSSHLTLLTGPIPFWWLALQTTYRTHPISESWIKVTLWALPISKIHIWKIIVSHH